MKPLIGLALSAAAFVLATSASAAPPMTSPAASAAHNGAASRDKKSPADCATVSVAKPESDGDGTAKPANAAASPDQSQADDRQLAPVDGSGGAKPTEAGPAAAPATCAAPT